MVSKPLSTCWPICRFRWELCDAEDDGVLRLLLEGLRVRDAKAAEEDVVACSSLLDNIFWFTAIHEVPGGPDCIAFAPDGALWTTLRWAGRIARLDPKTGDVSTIRVGRSPHGIFVQPVAAQ